MIIMWFIRPLLVALSLQLNGWHNHGHESTNCRSPARFCVATTATEATVSTTTTVTSERHLKIQNLNWSTPTRRIEQQFVQALNNMTSNCTWTSLIMKPVNTSRRRDRNKQHGGSAILEFDDASQAALARQALLYYFDTQQLDYRIQHARIPCLPLTVATPTPLLTKIQLETRRKERAAQYARRRIRVAQRTDDILQRLELLQRCPGELPLLEVTPLDWSSCPSAIDPAQGGGLVDASPRAQRKRASVEAFCQVVHDLLLLLPQSRSLEDDGAATTTALTIADLGCGTGNLALPLQWGLQQQQQQQPHPHGRQPQPTQTHVVAVDYNTQSLQRLEQRAQQASLSVETMACNLQHLMTATTTPATTTTRTTTRTTQEANIFEDCDMMLSLHACGAASDMALAAAVHRQLPFAISPCCIGKVRQWYYGPPSSTTNQDDNLSNDNLSDNRTTISYPRSQWLREAVSLEEYELLAKAADYGGSHAEHETSMSNDATNDNNTDNNKDSHSKVQQQQQLQQLQQLQLAEDQRRQRCRRAKRFVEMDRLAWAQQHGYQVGLVELPRLGKHYLKRELLLGAPVGTVAAERIRQLVHSTIQD